MKPSNLKVSVKNFGPIREGTVEFKPLTVFIGPNNSGKSYMGILVYSLFQAVSYRDIMTPFPTVVLPIQDFTDDQMKTIRMWVSRLARAGSTDGDALSGQLPQDIRGMVQDAFDQQMYSLVQRMPSTLTDYFGCDSLDDLVFRSPTRNETLTVDVGKAGNETAFLRIVQEPGAPSHATHPVTPSANHIDLQSLNLPEWLIEDPDDAFALLCLEMWQQAVASKGFPKGRSYYLPSGRSGILQGWQPMTSLVIRALRHHARAGPNEVPAFTGVAGDFLQELLERVFQTRRRVGSSSLDKALEILEGKILQGLVQVPTRMSEDSTIYYQTESLRIPIQRSSSMVSELAPLDIWIRSLVYAGDVLIIDEPEAHLHPENQRLIAQVLVRLMNSGVKVICATHSSMILHQISNHILAGSTTDERRHEHGFGEHDIIKPQDVGVYLFKPGTDGVAIENVEIEPEFGIPEDEFVRIADEISEQTYRLIT